MISTQWTQEHRQGRRRLCNASLIHAPQWHKRQCLMPLRGVTFKIGLFEVATDALPATLTLFDPQGRTVYSATLRAARTTIGTADLPHGIYHVVVATADGRSAKRRLVLE